MNPRRSAPESSSAACVPSPSVPPSERFATNSGGAETVASETCAVVAVAFSAVPRSSFFSEIDAATSPSAEDGGAPSRSDASPAVLAVFGGGVEGGGVEGVLPSLLLRLFDTFLVDRRVGRPRALGARERIARRLGEAKRFFVVPQVLGESPDERFTRVVLRAEARHRVFARRGPRGERFVARAPRV